MHRLLAFIFFTLFFSTAAPAVEKITYDTIAGEYTSGGTDARTDTFRLVGLSAATLYFNTDLYSSNGHSCELYGIADLEGNELVYHGPLNRYGNQCVMRFGISDDAIVFNDNDGNCQPDSCGSRMGYGSASFPRSSRAKLRYPEKMLENEQYFAAQAEYADQKSGDESRMRHDRGWYYHVGFAEYLKRQAEKGDLSAQVSLGSAYQKGEGVPLDLKEAEKWYLKAAEKGDFSAQWHLGRLYAITSPEKYLPWMMKAAKQGYSMAYYSLADAYEFGYEFGGVLNNVEASFWLRLALQADVDRGVPISQDRTNRMDNLISMLTNEQYKEVKKRAAAWKPVSTSPHRKSLKPKAQ